MAFNHHACSPVKTFEIEVNHELMDQPTTVFNPERRTPMEIKLGHALAFVAVALVLAVPCNARPHGRMFNVNRLAEPLGLDQKQTAAIEKLQDQTADKILDLRRDAQGKQYDLHKLMTQDAPNQSKIFSLIDELYKIRADIHKARVSAMLEIRNVLTPEQRDKLEELRLSHPRGKQMMSQHRGRFPREPADELEGEEGF
jgi:Spy/CpxP family protein refolding chaperone